VEKTRSSPIEKRIRKPFTFLHKKAPKQNTAPRNVVTDRSCKIKECRLSELLVLLGMRDVLSKKATNFWTQTLQPFYYLYFLKFEFKTS
jgi:hypothetical protein